MVSVPLRDVTSRISIMYACNAAHLKKRGRGGEGGGAIMSLTGIEN